MLKTAVIGVGNMGAHHARLYNDSDDVTLVGIADPDPDTVDAVGRRYKVPTYGDYQVMLDERSGSGNLNRGISGIAA